jgi:hypothetical protein
MAGTPPLSLSGEELESHPGHASEHSRHGAFGPPPPVETPSLRGAHPRGGEPKETVETKHYIDREIKIDINPLPTNYDGYPRWRYALGAAILQANVNPELAMLFVEDMSLLSFEELTPTTLPKELRQLDLKLFGSVVKAVKGPEHNEHMDDIEARVRLGSGRQAVRVLDEAHKYQLDLIASKSAAAVVGTVCKDMSQLPKYVAAFQLHLAHMASAGTPLHPKIGLEILKNAVQSVQNQQLAATLAQFEATPAGMQNLKTLVDALVKICQNYKERQNDKGKLAAAGMRDGKNGVSRPGGQGGGHGAAAVPNPATGKTCSFCGKLNHFARDCRAKQAAEGNWPGTGKGKGKGKGKSKKGKSKGGYAGDTHPPCPTCKKTNHAAADCWFVGKGNASTTTPTGAASVVPTVSGTVLKPHGAAAPAGLETLIMGMLAKKLNLNVAGMQGTRV